MKEALFYTKHKNNAIRCQLCPHECEIPQNRMGLCKVRHNIGGTLYTKTYNKISSFAIDPIEKKPLKNYKPGTYVLSVGTVGCNFKCDFCQNYHIAQMEPPLKDMTADDLLMLSDTYEESIGIAFTYNEPTIWYEYVYEAAQKNGKDTILVTNGYINSKPLVKLLPYINTMNIDLKSMQNSFYKKICRGDLESVQRTITTAYEYTHIELTFLAIPGLNDSHDEMKQMAEWISSIDSSIPLHIIPFRPMYKMQNLPYQTPQKIKELKNIASGMLKYVY